MRPSSSRLIFVLLLCGFHHCYGENNDHSTSKSTQAKDHHDHKHLIYQREFKDYDWVNSLIWNLIGYSTVLVPAFAIYRMAKYSNFNEKEGTCECFFAKLWTQLLKYQGPYLIDCSQHLVFTRRFHFVYSAFITCLFGESMFMNLKYRMVLLWNFKATRFQKLTRFQRLVLCECS